MKQKKFIETREEKSWVQDETVKFRSNVVYIFDQELGQFIGFEKNTKTAKDAIIRLKDDTRNYSRFSKEESGIWTYIPRNTRIKEKIYLIGRREDFHREALGELVDAYIAECRQKAKRK